MRAVFYLAAKSTDHYLSIREISDQLGISFPFLTKILQNLSEARIIDSAKGARGGVRLAQKADEIMLVDVYFAIEGRNRLDRCIMGLGTCGKDHACPLHKEYSIIRKSIRQFLNTKTLFDIVDNELEGTTLRLFEQEPATTPV